MEGSGQTHDLWVLALVGLTSYLKGMSILVLVHYESVVERRNLREIESRLVVQECYQIHRRFILF